MLPSTLLFPVPDWLLLQMRMNKIDFRFRAVLARELEICCFPHESRCMFGADVAFFFQFFFKMDRDACFLLSLLLRLRALGQGEPLLALARVKS